MFLSRDIDGMRRSSARHGSRLPRDLASFLFLFHSNSSSFSLGFSFASSMRLSREFVHFHAI